MTQENRTAPQALDVVISPSPNGERRFSLDVPAGWAQGRGAFGGLVLGGLARAMEACEPDATRALRSLAGEIAGPVLVGSAEIEVEPVRIGSGVSTWSAKLTQKGEVLARATTVFGKPRTSTRRVSPKSPEGAKKGAWSEVEPAPFLDGLSPEFTQHLEFRSTGPLPFSGHHEAVASGWIRARLRTAPLRSSDLVALIDSYWPANIAIEAGPRPFATIAFTFQALVTDAITSESPLYYQSRTLAERDGYIVEQRELWTEEGELLALNQQTVCIIK